KVTRVFSDSQGDSHFSEIEVPLRDQGSIGSLSDPVASEGVMFRENAPDYDYDWHTAPRRQFIVLLDGEIELQVSDGEARRFRGGDVLLVEDTNGKVHRTKNLTPERRRSTF